ncbi:hypothetical protein [Aureimonas pseudogalii]|uniref:Argininosuccinate lyase n=1 Tax=Aureimonas pseudogalii TaxID=1744844 RepID=A0A7W6ECJ3_9HYPH|nr:hypothetical protein [Aureimonas pseudogalii]MBB3997526.1 hypothetical protein [Aureimonas pseudogalii]
MRRLLLSALLLSALAGCGGMNRAVTVLPNTLDNLAADTEPLRTPRQPGDDALAARPR